MELPSIAVITPSLNAAGTIEDTLASVRDQGYPRLDHLVVDGGSTDGTLAILERTEGIRYVTGRDGGRPQAVNKGIGMTTAEVVGFLNADDRYEPGALEAVGSAFARDPGAMWATGYCRIIDGSGCEIRRPVKRYKDFLLRHWSFPRYLTQNFVSDPATFVRRPALEEAGELDPRYRISHDYDLWLRIARRHDPIVIERDLSSFRMTEGTLSMSGFERQFREHAECARRHGDGHPLAVGANAFISVLIVAAYRMMRLRRNLRPGGSPDT